MRVSLYRSDLPDWAKEAMLMVCPYCNSFILDNSDTGVMTARMCSNKYCPGHMSYKMKSVADYFGVKGFGPKTALNYIRIHKCKNHLEILREWFPNDKPFISLADVAVLACVDGYGEVQAKKELNHFNSFTEYFYSCTSVNPLLHANRQHLLECEKYFEIKPALSENRLYVMATGAFHNFRSRDEYFNLLNDAFGQYIQVVQTGKRKTGVSYLIKERDAVDRSKSQIAKECGIPIVTPAEFMAILTKLNPYSTEK